MTDSLTGPGVCCSEMQNEEWNAAGQGTVAALLLFFQSISKVLGKKLHAQGRKVKIEEVCHVTEFSQPLPTWPRKQDQ